MIAELASTPVEALPDADRITSLLKRAWQESADADRDYLSAYSAVEGHCKSASLTRNRNYIRATGHSTKATARKQEFVDIWNPIAQRYSLPTWKDTQI